MLSGKEIIKEIDAGNIRISPYDPDRVGPNSYELTLSDEMYVYKGRYFDGRVELDMRQDNPIEKIDFPESGLLLEPGKLYLGCTLESTYTGKYVPMIEGRSSIGRLGILVHLTAGFGDVGFDGRWTLEITPIVPVRIYPNVKVCHIYFHELSGDNTIQYTGKYAGNTGVQNSMLYKDFYTHPER